MGGAVHCTIISRMGGTIQVLHIQAPLHKCACTVCVTKQQMGLLHGELYSVMVE